MHGGHRSRDAEGVGEVHLDRSRQMREWQATVKVNGEELWVKYIYIWLYILVSAINCRCVYIYIYMGVFQK